MHYQDGQEARVGDLLALIENGTKGVIVADLENRIFAHDFPAKGWEYLTKGVFVRLEDSALVLIDELDEDTILIARGTEN